VLSHKSFRLQPIEAGSDDAKNLTPHGLKVRPRRPARLHGQSSTKHLVHLCETTVCYISIYNQGGQGTTDREDDQLRQWGGCDQPRTVSTTRDVMR